MRHVEFFGLCGSGKTTLIQELKPLFQSRPDYQWMGPLPLNSRQFRFSWIAYATKLFLKNPVKAYSLMRDKTLRQLSQKIAYRLGGVWTIKEKNKKLLLQETGLFQPFIDFTIREEVDVLPYIRTMLSFLSVPKVMVYVNTKPEIAKSRFENREKITKTMKNYQQAERVCEKLCKHLENQGVSIIHFDASEALSEDSIEALHKKITEKF